MIERGKLFSLTTAMMRIPLILCVLVLSACKSSSPPIQGEEPTGFSITQGLTEPPPASPTSSLTITSTTTAALTPAVTVAKAGPWVQKADMPTARYALSTSVVDGIIYAIGGVPGPNGPPLSTMEAYNPVTDTWTKKADMPTARFILSTSVVNGIIYAIGGSPAEVSPGSTYATVEAYDPVTNTWTKKADMPTARSGFSAIAVDGIIYAMGGTPDNSSTLSTVEAYDPQTDTWTTVADMPSKLVFFSASEVNGEIYVMGGAPVWHGTSAAIFMYEPETDTWSTKSDMPMSRTFLSTSVVNGMIYAIGGGVSGSSKVEVYDPATDSWTSKPDMTTARTYLATNSVGGKIYAIGGRAYHGAQAFAIVEEYTPEDPLSKTWDHMVLGDSFAARSEYAELFAAYLEGDLGVEIDLHQRASSGQTTETSLDRVLDDEALRSLIVEAEVITINWSPSSLDAPERVYLNGECGGDDNQDCLRLAQEEIQSAWEALLDEFIAIRGSEKTIIRAFAFGTWPELAFYAGYGPQISPEQLEVLLDNFLSIDRRLMETAEERSVLVVDLFEAFQQGDPKLRPPEEYFQSDE